MKKTISFIAYLLCLKCHSSVYEPHVLWNKQEITVCFVDRVKQIKMTRSKESLNAKFVMLSKKYQQKWYQYIQNRVETNFNIKQTGIHFVGWKNCSEEPNADAYILLDRSRQGIFKQAYKGGIASIGEDGIFEDEGFYSKGNKKPYVRINIRGSQKRPIREVDLFLQMMIIHEFGHLAGLRHEHIRREALKDELCIEKYREGEKQFLFELRGETAQEHGDYDGESIMNYCINKNPDIYSRGNLSEGDKSLLRHLYQINEI